MSINIVKINSEDPTKTTGGVYSKGASCIKSIDAASSNTDLTNRDAEDPSTLCDTCDDAVLASECEFLVESGDTAIIGDDANGSANIACGDVIHFWSSNDSVSVLVSAGSAIVDIQAPHETTTAWNIQSGGADPVIRFIDEDSGNSDIQFLGEEPITVDESGNIITISLLLKGYIEFPKIADRKHTLHAGVIRYNAGLGRWATLEEIDGSHDAIAISSVASDNSAITINHDTSGHGAQPRVVYSGVVPDETLSAEGITAGVSANVSTSTITLRRKGINDYISHAGPGDDDWTSAEGYFDSFSWNAGLDRLEADITSRVAFNTIDLGAGVQLCGRGVHAVNDGFGSGAPQLRVQFITYGAAAVQATPTGNPAVCVFFPDTTVVMRPNTDFPGNFENVWFLAIVESDE